MLYIRIGDFNLQVKEEYKISKDSVKYFIEYFNFNNLNPYLSISKIDEVEDWIDAYVFMDSFSHEVNHTRSSVKLQELEILYSSFDLVGIYPLIDESLKGETKYQDLLNGRWDSLFSG